MDKIHIIFTSSLNRDIGHVTSEPIIAFGSRSAAKAFMKERIEEDDKPDQKESYSKEGIYDVRWWMEEISLNDMNLTGDTRDRLEAKWEIKDADNGWKDWVCTNCGFTKNLEPSLILGYKYCPECGCTMVNPKGGK